MKIKIVENDNLFIDSLRLDCITLKGMYQELNLEGLRASKMLPGGYFELDSLVYFLSSIKIGRILDKKEVTLTCLGTVAEVMGKQNIKMTEEQELFWDNVNSEYKNYNYDKGTI